jgi:hypothetical protein
LDIQMPAGDIRAQLRDLPADRAPGCLGGRGIAYVSARRSS